ncbi:MAG: hypothetical protein A2934_00625 [Candidatus Sungbacteria bacterium RIFCSPLOWO2_01_FULL_47_10]|uniref:Bacterial sugar transferase domain-containing protein n=1 Tax=Candidatus Sungbacteria bacterium RIFCSPLOWO2_01_FULL_47_10 TaxID=1802276 RepID=A0A1G2L7R6_9BACT|nr:MAG: hypothetical protein A2934_00625 [Candidatus Sungbacteria bacterium RIFCSPLOWO2_01_FULL_47_10]
MGNGSKKPKLAILFLGDIAILYTSLYLALTARNLSAPGADLWNQHLIPFSIVFAIWLSVFIIAGLYELRLTKNESRFLERLMKAITANAALATLLFYLVPAFRIAPKTNLFLTIVFSTVLIFAWRLIFNGILPVASRNKILFFGATREAVDMADYLRANPQFGYDIIGLMLAEKEELPQSLPYPIFAFNHGLGHVIRDYSVDTVVVSENIKENKTFVRMFFEIIPLGAAIVDFPEFYEGITGKIPVSLIQEVWFLEHLVGGKKRIFEFFKRTIDIAVSLVLLLPTLALTPFVSLFIKISSPGPTFYRQKRIGRHGREFELIKFRSMVKDADQIGGFKKIEGKDPRYTPVGLFLRKSYVDELPQILNVLRGDMSFVGPRPERPEYVQDLKKNIPFYEMRLLVLPGITGWAQINMEDDASVEDAPKKMQYDLYYIKNQSFLLDINIILKTILTILSRSGR